MQRTPQRAKRTKKGHSRNRSSTSDNHSSNSSANYMNNPSLASKSIKVMEGYLEKLKQLESEKKRVIKAMNSSSRNYEKGYFEEEKLTSNDFQGEPVVEEASEGSEEEPERSVVRSKSRRMNYQDISRSPNFKENRGVSKKKRKQAKTEIRPRRGIPHHVAKRKLDKQKKAKNKNLPKTNFKQKKTSKRQYSAAKSRQRTPGKKQGSYAANRRPGRLNRGKSLTVFKQPQTSQNRREEPTGRVKDTGATILTTDDTSMSGYSKKLIPLNNSASKKNKSFYLEERVSGDYDGASGSAMEWRGGSPHSKMNRSFNKKNRRNKKENNHFGQKGHDQGVKGHQKRQKSAQKAKKQPKSPYRKKKDKFGNLPKNAKSTAFEAQPPKKLKRSKSQRPVKRERSDPRLKIRQKDPKNAKNQKPQRIQKSRSPAKLKKQHSEQKLHSDSRVDIFINPGRNGAPNYQEIRIFQANQNDKLSPSHTRVVLHSPNRAPSHPIKPFKTREPKRFKGRGLQMSLDYEGDCQEFCRVEESLVGKKPTHEAPASPSELEFTQNESSMSVESEKRFNNHRFSFSGKNPVSKLDPAIDRYRVEHQSPSKSGFIAETLASTKNSKNHNFSKKQKMSKIGKNGAPRPPVLTTVGSNLAVMYSEDDDMVELSDMNPDTGRLLSSAERALVTGYYKQSKESDPGRGCSSPSSSTQARKLDYGDLIYSNTKQQDSFKKRLGAAPGAHQLEYGSYQSSTYRLTKDNYRFPGSPTSNSQNRKIRKNGANPGTRMGVEAVGESTARINSLSEQISQNLCLNPQQQQILEQILKQRMQAPQNSNLSTKLDFGGVGGTTDTELQFSRGFAPSRYLDQRLRTRDNFETFSTMKVNQHLLQRDKSVDSLKGRPLASTNDHILTQVEPCELKVESRYQVVKSPRNGSKSRGESLGRSSVQLSATQQSRSPSKTSNQAEKAKSRKIEKLSPEATKGQFVTLEECQSEQFWQDVKCKADNSLHYLKDRFQTIESSRLNNHFKSSGPRQPVGLRHRMRGRAGPQPAVATVVKEVASKFKKSQKNFSKKIEQKIEKFGKSPKFEHSGGTGEPPEVYKCFNDLFDDANCSSTGLQKQILASQIDNLTMTEISQKSAFGGCSAAQASPPPPKPAVTPEDISFRNQHSNQNSKLTNSPKRCITIKSNVSSSSPVNIYVEDAGIKISASITELNKKIVIPSPPRRRLNKNLCTSINQSIDINKLTEKVFNSINQHVQNRKVRGGVEVNGEGLGGGIVTQTQN